MNWLILSNSTKTIGGCGTASVGNLRVQSGRVIKHQPINAFQCPFLVFSQTILSQQLKWVVLQGNIGSWSGPIFTVCRTITFPQHLNKNYSNHQTRSGEHLLCTKILIQIIRGKQMMVNPVFVNPSGLTSKTKSLWMLLTLSQAPLKNQLIKQSYSQPEKKPTQTKSSK